MVSTASLPSAGRNGGVVFVPLAATGDLTRGG